MANTGDTLGQLNALVRAKTGDSSARAHSLETLPGHAGFSYSFVLERTDGRDPAGKLVLRLAPPNVRISGPADVVRQAKIMASMVRTAVPVPRVYWFGDEPEFFGRPYFVVSYVNGVKLADEPFPKEQIELLARKGIETLAALHSLPWEPRRSAFGDPFPLSEEMKRLDNLLDRPTLDPMVVARARELRECLSEAERKRHEILSSKLRNPERVSESHALRLSRRRSAKRRRGCGRCARLALACRAQRGTARAPHGTDPGTLWPRRRSDSDFRAGAGSHQRV
jgi:Phosphotransferase enzyme family